jgi:hypothetical protein
MQHKRVWFTSACMCIVVFLLSSGPMPPARTRPLYVGHARGSTSTLRRPSWMNKPVFGADPASSASNVSDPNCLAGPPYASRKVHFFSFASGPYLKALKRISEEAEETGAFDAVHAFTPEDIDRDYYEAHRDVLALERGVGYWLWKPYFLSLLLSRLQCGDIVMYADSGCEFTGNPAHYVDLASEYGFVGFKLPLTFHQLRRWTKGDIFDALGMDMDTFGGERQHVGGIWLFQKRTETLAFVQDWLHFSEDAQLITDAPSVTPDHPDFQENRHDQSIYSLLLYKHGLQLVLEDRTFPRENAPIIHAARKRD